VSEPLNIFLSGAALAVSGVTAWLTLFRRGTVQMTQPTVIFFGFDGGRPPIRGPKSKVFLRTLLYSPAKRGALVESMYIRVRRGEAAQNFNVWVYGDGERLLRGSGLFVPETGVATNHHFLLPESVESFEFSAGSYDVEVFASVVGKKAPRRLFAQRLVISERTANLLPHYGGVYFDLSADSSTYSPVLETQVIGERKRTSGGVIPMASGAYLDAQTL
jgi:hypothetical protein